MSTLFESAVYALEQNAPYCGPKPIAFMADHASFGGECILKVRYRPDVASRKWFTLQWREDPNAQWLSASGQTADKCFWRAIQLHKQQQKENYAARIHSGYTGGDGI